MVTWIHMPGRDEHYENAAETVQRYLRNACGPKPRVSSELRLVPSHLASEGRFLPILHAARKLPWHERFKKWERWTVALADEDSKHQAYLIPPKLVRHSIPAEDALDTPNGQPGGWSAGLQTDTSVLFGHVLFSRLKEHSLSAASFKPATLDMSLSRTFLPTLPALGSLNLPNNLYEEGLWHTTTVVRFEPSLEVAAAPGLELRIEADNREIIRLVSLRAVRETLKTDVLFPTAAVDARLVQQRYFTLPGIDIGEHVPSILTFLSKSVLRPWDCKFSTPPVLLGVRLPRRLLDSAVPNDHNHTTATPTDIDMNGVPSVTDAAPVSIDYTLASIEVHRTVTAALDGLKLRYTSIQGDQRSGQRAELSLEAVRTTEAQARGEIDPAVAAVAAAKARARSGSGSGSGSGAAPVSADASADYFPPRTPQSLLLTPPSVDEYELADEEEVKEERAGLPKMDTHFLHTGVAVAQQPVEPRKPVTAEEFLRVASGIVNETSGLKWHLKRS
jgi:hypothetical protein